MSLLEELSKPTGAGCGYALALGQLNDKERAAVETAVAGSAWGPVALAEVFERNRVVISQQHISRHRAGGCKQCRS